MKDNKNKLEEIYKEDFENYENELSFYLNIIKVEDAFKILKETKKSQKDELITFMDDLLKYKEKTTNEFENYLNSFEEFYKKAKYYNMPADRKNEELCYYGYLHLIKYSLNNLSKLIKEKKMKIETDDSIDKDMKIKKKKKIVNDELDLLIHKTSKTRDYITQNQYNFDEIRYLIILLVQSINENEFNFGYNLITSKKLMKMILQNSKRKMKLIKNII